MLTLLTRYFEWTDLFAIALRTLEFLFQVNSETLEMKTVPTGSFAVEDIVKTDGAVDLRVDVVLALDDVFGGGEFLGLFFGMDFGPFAGASV